MNEEGLAAFNATGKYIQPWTKEIAALYARGYVAYELSNRLAEKYVSPELKQFFQDMIGRLIDSFRARIEALDWMSETTRANALEKLDNMMVFAGSPDNWYDDCLPDLSECKSLVEAVHKLLCSRSTLYKHLIGTRDVFSFSITKIGMGSDLKPFTPDLAVVNSNYNREFNGIFILPAMMIPPMFKRDASEAYQYAMMAVEAHEITHGFDSNGSSYDANGRIKNWWTVADKMAFEDLQEQIIQCYNLLEYDPVLYPGVFSDGKRTLAENIADLGGFLIARDAYIKRLHEQGFTGENFTAQLKKFHEAYAYLFSTKYSAEKLNVLMTVDFHSHSRLRVNGVVMNTDMWYDLYGVTRDNILYLPPEHRTYIW